MPASAQQKIAYVNSAKLLDQAPGAAEAKTTLQKELASYKAQIDAMDDSLSNLVADFQSKSVLLSPDAKQKRQDDIVAKQNAWKAKADAMQQKANERQQQVMQPILDKIRNAIIEVRKADGYAIIFDAATDAMIDGDPALDLTDKVIAKLKAVTPAAPGKN
jgi:outer membrane protein